jgi:hypothetical protein
MDGKLGKCSTDMTLDHDGGSNPRWRALHRNRLRGPAPAPFSALGFQCCDLAESTSMGDARATASDDRPRRPTRYSNGFLFRDLHRGVGSRLGHLRGNPIDPEVLSPSAGLERVIGTFVSVR